jgi:hypothetical protein
MEMDAAVGADILFADQRFEMRAKMPVASAPCARLAAEFE